MTDTLTATDQQLALDVLRLEVEADLFPALSDEELYQLLGAPRYTTWQASTAYAVNRLVTPSVRNGHLYRAIVGGTSLTTEPVWPLATVPGTDWYDATWSGYSPSYEGESEDFGLTVLGASQTADGPTLIWQEAGQDFLPRFDVQLACYRAWRKKAGKATSDYDVTVDRDQYSRSQVYKQCMAMANEYRSGWIV